MSGLKTALAIAVLGTIVITLYFVQQLHGARQSTAQLGKRAAQLELQLQHAPLRLGSPMPAPAADGAATPVAVRAAKPEAASMEGSSAYGRHLLALYPGLHAQLGLDESEARTFHKLLVSSGTRPADLRALLGSRYQQFIDLQNTSEAKSWTSELRQVLGKTANPLSEEQARQLDLARLAEQERRSAELRVLDRPTEPHAVLDYQKESLKIVEASDGRFAAAVRSYLTPQQVAVVQVSMERQLNAQRANLRIRSALVEAGGDGSSVIPRALMPATY